MINSTLPTAKCFVRRSTRTAKEKRQQNVKVCADCNLVCCRYISLTTLTNKDLCHCCSLCVSHYPLFAPTDKLQPSRSDDSNTSEGFDSTGGIYFHEFSDQSFLSLKVAALTDLCQLFSTSEHEKISLPSEFGDLSSFLRSKTPKRMFSERCPMKLRESNRSLSLMCSSNVSSDDGKNRMRSWSVSSAEKAEKDSTAVNKKEFNIENENSEDEISMVKIDDHHAANKGFKSCAVPVTKIDINHIDVHKLLSQNKQQVTVTANSSNRNKKQPLSLSDGVQSDVKVGRGRRESKTVETKVDDKVNVSSTRPKSAAQQHNSHNSTSKVASNIKKTGSIAESEKNRNGKRSLSRQDTGKSSNNIKTNKPQAKRRKLDGDLNAASGNKEKKVLSQLPLSVVSSNVSKNEGLTLKKEIKWEIVDEIDSVEVGTKKSSKGKENAQKRGKDQVKIETVRNQNAKSIHKKKTTSANSVKSTNTSSNKNNKAKNSSVSTAASQEVKKEPLMKPQIWIEPRRVDRTTDSELDVAKAFKVPTFFPPSRQQYFNHLLNQKEPNVETEAFVYSNKVEPGTREKCGFVRDGYTTKPLYRVSVNDHPDPKMSKILEQIAAIPYYEDYY